LANPIFLFTFLCASSVITAKSRKLNLVSPCRNSKPKNRPSFQQVLLHVEIAAGDVLKTPQEIYLNKQVRQNKTKRRKT